MSGWRIHLKEIDDLGGWVHIGALKGGCLTSLGTRKALQYAHDHGFLDMRRGKNQNSPTHWRITDKGRDLLEGRIRMEVPPYTSPLSAGRAKGSTVRPVATWLMALPRPGEIRLGAA